MSFPNYSIASYIDVVYFRTSISLCFLLLYDFIPTPERMTYRTHFILFFSLSTNYTNFSNYYMFRFFS